MTPLLEAKQLTKVFEKGSEKIPVLRGVDFSVHSGERIAITGASGVGKSTLLHILGTLEAPTAGKVYFEGNDLFAMKDAELSRFRNGSLGFVFQFHHLLPEFSALENVLMPMMIAGLSQPACINRATELLQFVGLGHRLSHRPAELSGGEQQRVAIARAVALKPKVLMADELTGNLDSANSGVVMDLLQKLNQSSGIAILMVTHDLDLAKKMQRVITMRDGVFVSEIR